MVEIDPEQWDAQNNLGKTYHELGRPDSALHHYRLALEADSAFAGAHFNKGVLFATQGLIDSAIASYETAIRHDSTHYEARNNLGVMYEGSGRVAAAIAEYERATEQKEAFAPAYANLARASLLAGDRKRAIRSAHKAVETLPGLIDGYITLATAYVLEHEYDRAIQFLEEARGYAPDHELVNQNLAYVRQKKAEYIEARDSGAMRASHIVVKNAGLAEVLIEKARSGEDFALLARTHSIDPTGSAGGDLGYFQPGDMMPEFEAVVRDLQPGQVGGPLKTPLGYHIIKRIY